MQMTKSIIHKTQIPARARERTFQGLSQVTNQMHTSLLTPHLEQEHTLLRPSQVPNQMRTSLATPLLEREHTLPRPSQVTRNQMHTSLVTTLRATRVEQEHMLMRVVMN